MKLCKYLQIFCNEISTTSDSTTRAHASYFSSSEQALCILISIVQSLRPDEVWRLGIFLGNYCRNAMISAYAYVRASFSTNTELPKNTAGDTVALWSAAFIVSCYFEFITAFEIEEISIMQFSAWPKPSRWPAWSSRMFFLHWFICNMDFISFIAT